MNGLALLPSSEVADGDAGGGDGGGGEVASDSQAVAAEKKALYDAKVKAALDGAEAAEAADESEAAAELRSKAAHRLALADTQGQVAEPAAEQKVLSRNTCLDTRL